MTQFLRAIRPSKPQLHPENVNAIVEESVRFFAPEIKDRDIVVEKELRSDLPLLELDRDQMKQVFYNVIKNSFEAMKRRGILRIRTDRDDTHVMISFTDTGGGISAENLSRVFEPYFTTKASARVWACSSFGGSFANTAGNWRSRAAKAKGLRLRFVCPFWTASADATGKSGGMRAEGLTKNRSNIDGVWSGMTRTSTSAWKVRSFGLAEFVPPSKVHEIR